MVKFNKIFEKQIGCQPPPAGEISDCSGVVGESWTFLGHHAGFLSIYMGAAILIGVILFIVMIFLKGKNFLRISLPTIIIVTVLITILLFFILALFVNESFFYMM